MRTSGRPGEPAAHRARFPPLSRLCRPSVRAPPSPGTLHPTGRLPMSLVGELLLGAPRWGTQREGQEEGEPRPAIPLQFSQLLAPCPAAAGLLPDPCSSWTGPTGSPPVTPGSGPWVPHGCWVLSVFLAACRIKLQRLAWSPGENSGGRCKASFPRIEEMTYVYVCVCVYICILYKKYIHIYICIYINTYIYKCVLCVYVYIISIIHPFLIRKK